CEQLDLALRCFIHYIDVTSRLDVRGGDLGANLVAKRRELAAQLGTEFRILAAQAGDLRAQIGAQRLEQASELVVDHRFVLAPSMVRRRALRVQNGSSSSRSRSVSLIG